MKKPFLLTVVALVALGVLYFLVVFNWNYSDGERAGWVQKFSRKGWICKTWEGELSMVSMPGATPEKFLFTVWDDKVAAEINAAMGRRVSLHYAEKVGLPTSCFGETRHYVNRITIVQEIPLAPGVMVPMPAPSGDGAPAAPAQPPGQVAPVPVTPPPPPAPPAGGSTKAPTQ